MTIDRRAVLVGSAAVAVATVVPGATVATATSVVTLPVNAVKLVPVSPTVAKWLADPIWRHISINAPVDTMREFFQRCGIEDRALADGCSPAEALAKALVPLPARLSLADRKLEWGRVDRELAAEGVTPPASPA
jgi:hypothetical protein